MYKHIYKLMYVIQMYVKTWIAFPILVAQALLFTQHFRGFFAYFFALLVYTYVRTYKCYLEIQIFYDYNNY